MKGFTLKYLLLLSLGWLLSCESPEQQAELYLQPELAWVEGGEAEVRAYLDALAAERVYLAVAEPMEESSVFAAAPDSLLLSVVGSPRLSALSDSQQQAQVDHLALVIMDNLADASAYESLVIHLQSHAGSTLLYQPQLTAAILRRRPRLH